MVKTIYIDVLFFVNLIINYLILFTCSKIGAIHFFRLKLFASSALGAAWSVISLAPIPIFFTSFFFKIIMSAILCLCAFGKDNLLKNTLLFLGITLTFGGIVFAASFLGTNTFLEIYNGVYYIHTPLPVLLGSCVASYFLLSIIFCRSAAQSSKKISNISITNGKETIVLRALHDTGNSLRDPSTNAPIVITDYKSARMIFPPPARSILDASLPSAYPMALDRLSEFGTFKLIPFKTVGNPFSLMLAYRPEKIMLNNKNIRGALVAISENSVSDGGFYHAII